MRRPRLVLADLLASPTAAAADPLHRGARQREPARRRQRQHLGARRPRAWRQKLRQRPVELPRAVPRCTACRTRSGHGGLRRSRRRPRSPRAYPDQVRIKSVRSAAFTGDLAAVGLQRCRSPFDVASGGDVASPSTTSAAPCRPRLLSIVNTLPVVGHRALATAGRQPRVRLHGDPAGRALRSSDGITPANPTSASTTSLIQSTWSRSASGGSGRTLIKPAFNQFVHSVITNAAATRAYLSYWEYGTVILDISDPAPAARLDAARPGAAGAACMHSVAHARREGAARDAGVRTVLQLRRDRLPRLFDLSDERTSA